jgi:hypothetical protein
MKKLLIVLLGFTFFACDIELTMPSTNVTNTNTNTVIVDIHDLVNFAPMSNPTTTPIPGGPNGTETPLPLPTSSQSIATTAAQQAQGALLRSCQEIYGEVAWTFMDTVLNSLKASDPRWGYMVKPTNGQISRDVIAYRATSDNTGSWGVDIIVDHCGQNPTFAWNVLGFDPAAQWAGTRF